MRLKLLDLKSIIEEMDNYDFETGGIILTKNNKVNYLFDKGVSESIDKYRISKEIIDLIADEYFYEYTFVGIIHSHRFKTELSYADTYYARKVLKNNKLHSILMPIYVLKEKCVYWYLVTYDDVINLGIQMYV